MFFLESKQICVVVVVGGGGGGCLVKKKKEYMKDIHCVLQKTYSCCPSKHTCLTVVCCSSKKFWCSVILSNNLSQAIEEKVGTFMYKN